ncbi:regulator of G-protein signaling 7-like [Liolophura sinensis]|uniref:regulator of G-protein signaling 7-like n=1 Tax=Liolophura sinensis TaxID=3198878 RepID=UPI0031584FFB
MTITPHAMDINEDKRPRSMVVSKMENIIKSMQHPETGIPVRSQKMFLTTIPCAFTGYDLCDWLMDHLDIEDSPEALHLANLLCQHGYFFPITDVKNLSVKDDGSFYRFQSPCYWPSHNPDPDNVDYAIYLAKRTMRNKQKHGLEEYEQASFNKLQKMLCDKWEFIFMQAEEQVRLAKDRKKGERVVVDSQERAFWRVHRPPPGQIKHLQQAPQRNIQPSQMAARRKKNIDLLRRELAYLSLSMARPRLKVSKAVESFNVRFEMYKEHDPALSQPQPSNPWITDDVTFWELEADLIEFPTERRVKRWAFGFYDLMSDPRGRIEFEQFLQKEYSQENIRFWKACEQMKITSLSKVPHLADKIYKEFLAAGAPCEVNIDCRTMDKVLENLKKPSRYTFEAAQHHIYMLMKKDSYSRFLRSEDYKNLLACAHNPGGKKKFFHFGSRRKPSPTLKIRRRNSISSDTNSQVAESVAGQHSYSTGNLRELEMKAPPCRHSVNGSDSSISKSDVSPTSVRKKLDKLKGESPSKRTLEVPTPYPVQNQELPHNDDTKSVAITVPTKLNAVAPWEA